MKTRLLIILISIATLSSCMQFVGSEESDKYIATSFSPEQTVSAFLRAFREDDLNEARSYVAYPFKKDAAGAFNFDEDIWKDEHKYFLRPFTISRVEAEYDDGTGRMNFPFKVKGAAHVRGYFAGEKRRTYHDFQLYIFRGKWKIYFSEYM